MHLIAPRGTARTPLARMHEALAAHVPTGPVHVVPLGPDREVAWFRLRATDALHVHPDGVLLGLRSLDAPDDGDSPVHHDDPVPTAGAPHVPSTTVTAAGVVRPHGTTSAYWCGSRVSDSQLVLADALGLRPSDLGVAILAAVGYLVGDETLFEEVRRITLGHRLDLGTARQEPAEAGPRPVPGTGDGALVERLVGLLPRSGDHHVALSGGLDSRIVLGLVRAAGLDPAAVSLRNLEGDHDAAARVAAQAGVESRVLPRGVVPEQVPDEVHTLVTDAQLYVGGTRWSRLGALVPDEGIVHLGLAGEGVFKNAFPSVWKRPVRERDVSRVAVERGLLSAMPDHLRGLRRPVGRSELATRLQERFAPLDALVPLATRKQHADWLFFHSRALRWAQASAAELLSARPVCTALDLDAWLIASRSGAWENHAHQRGRRLAHRLLPEVDEPLASGLPAVPPRGPAGVRERVEYDYLTRYRLRRRARHGAPLPTVARVVEAPALTPPSLLEHIAVPLDDLAAAGASLTTRRAARTLADVVRYLER